MVGVLKQVTVIFLQREKHYVTNPPEGDTRLIPGKGMGRWREMVKGQRFLRSISVPLGPCPEE